MTYVASDETTDERPHVAVNHRGHMRMTLVASHEYESLRDAWKGGKAFWDGDDAWGNPCTVKLGEVVGVVFWTHDGLRRLLADREIERAREMMG